MAEIVSAAMELKGNFFILFRSKPKTEIHHGDTENTELLFSFLFSVVSAPLW